MDGIYQSGSKPVITENYQYTEASSAVASAAVNPAPATGAETKEASPTADQIKSAISAANRRAHFGHTNAEFSYHEPTKRISVKIIDEETNEVIREIPPEETLEMISKMWELAGIMVDEKR